MSDKQVAKFRTALLAVLVIIAGGWVWLVYQDSAEGTLHDDAGAINEDSVELMEELSPIDDPNGSAGDDGGND